MTAPSEFNGRVALVTGGGSGIGRAIALRYAAGGGHVAVLGRHSGPLDETARMARQNGVHAHVISADVRDNQAVEEAVDDVVAKFGQLDAVVNNAAGNFIAAAEEMSANAWKAVIDIVLHGTFHCTRAAARHMLAARSGAILNVIASYAWNGHPGTVHSAAAKGGVLAMTRTLASEWGDRGVRVNCLSPGPTETEGASTALWPTSADRSRVLDSVPAGRFTTPEEIAEAAAFLLDDARAGYLTGDVLSVDGGQCLGKAVYGHSSGGLV